MKGRGRSEGKGAGTGSGKRKERGLSRSSFAALAVLLVILICVAVNAVYVNAVTERLTAMAKALPTEPSGEDPAILDAAIREISELLEAHEPLLNLSVSFQMIDRAHGLTDDLRAYARAGEAGHYAAARSALIDALGDIGRLERAAVESIF